MKDQQWFRTWPDLYAPQPHNTPDARLAVTNVPALMRDWSFATFPSALLAEPSILSAYETVRAWAETATPRCRGLVLTGSPGCGKTGLIVSALQARASAGDGDHAAWNDVTHPNVRRLVREGARPRLAPCWFSSWEEMAALLHYAMQSGDRQLYHDESPRLSLWKVWGQINARVSLLALDECDVDRLSPLKEQRLLDWTMRPKEGERLLMTLNHPLDSKRSLARLGERVTDRLFDSQHFIVLPISGPSARRLSA